MLRQRCAVAAALLGLALSVVHLSPGFAAHRLVESGWSAVPGVDTTAETLLLVTYLANATAFTIGIGAVFGLGYWVGTDLDLRNEYRALVISVAVGGLLGYLLPFVPLAVAPVLGTGSMLAGTSLLDGLLIAGRFLAVPIQFAVVALAGGAFATLRAEARVIESGPGSTDFDGVTSDDQSATD